MDEIKKITKELVKIESTSENPENLQETIDLVKKELKGFKFKEYKKNNVPSILFYNDEKGLKNGFKIILNGHLDVVKGKPDQFNPIEKDGKIYGRGSEDMKSGCATLIVAFRKLAKKITYPLGLLFNTDEEIGGFDGALHCVKTGLKAEILLAAEPTELKIARRSKGVCWIELSTKGKSAHGAYLWKGKNAIELLLKGIATIKNEFPTPSKEVWKTTANLSLISTTNKTVNKVPDNAQAKIDIRYIPENKHFTNKNTAQKYLKSLLPDKIKLKFIEFEPSASINEDNPYVVKLVKLIKENTNLKKIFKDSHGASDLRHFAKYEIPGIEFGPDGKNLHGDNEYVDLESLRDFYEILITYLTNL